MIGSRNKEKLIEKTINEAQAAGTYDVLTAVGDVEIIRYVLFQNTAGATFTSMSIQTNDTTPLVLMSDVEGALANLTAQKNMDVARPNDAPFTLRSGKKIQHTMVGSTGTGEMKALFIWRPISVGAYVY